MVRLQLITGTKPFPDVVHHGRIVRMIVNEPPILPSIVQHPSFAQLPELREIMVHCWSSDSQLRPRIGDCLAAVRRQVSDLLMRRSLEEGYLTVALAA